MIRITSIDDDVETENFQIINNDNNSNSNDNSNDNSINDITIISREREIFLRAALQLLDNKDDDNNNRLRYNNNDSSSTTRNSCRERSESSVSYLQCISSNIIRCGRLKKASRGGAFSGTTTWKIKYIEICHGIFSYEDENHGFIDNWSGTFENKSIQKTIALNVDTCRCRPYKAKNGHHDMFELNVAGGPRRIWQASSEEERDEWVNAIKNAMIGSAGDFVGQSIGQPAVSINEPTKRTISKSFMSVLDKNNYCEYGFSKQYTTGINVFKNIRNISHNSSSVQEYKEILDTLIKDKTKVIVPVSYIKMTLSSNNLFRETTTMQNVGRSVDSSQVWKDLQRDSIKVNGDIISGEHGPEAMIGAIVRHIFDKVQTIRSKISASLCDGTILSLHDSKNDYNFDLTEAQVMACARDLLILCNRTQSGGDTYFCVDSLLCNRDKELCILTPLASESDPLEIFVDIVQGTSHPVSSSNNNASDDNSYDSNYIDDDSTGITSTSTSGADVLSTTSTGEAVRALNGSLKVSSESSSIEGIKSIHSIHEKHDVPEQVDPGQNEGVETRRKAQLSLNLDEQDGVTLSSSTPAKFVRRSLDESIKKNALILDTEKKVKKWDDVSIISDITMDSTMDKSTLRGRRHSDPYNSQNSMLVNGKLKPATQNSMLVPGKLKPANQINNNYIEGTIIKNETIPKQQGRAVPEKIEQPEKTPSKGGFLSMLKTPLRKKKEKSTYFDDHNTPELPRMCVRIQVKAISKYRICDYNPQDENNDTWGVAVGLFEQCFFLKSNCNGRPSMSDRMVTISIQK